jgi:hypothetical protein
MPSSFGLLAAGYPKCPVSFTNRDIVVHWSQLDLLKCPSQALSSSKRPLVDHPLLLVRHFFFSTNRLFTPIKTLHSVLPSQAHSSCSVNMCLSITY